MGLTREPHVHVEIDAIELNGPDVDDLVAIESSVAHRLEGAADSSHAIAAAIARSIRAAVPDGG
jgi:hypothetical protein